MQAKTKRITEDEPDRFGAISLAEVCLIVDADGQGRPLIVPVYAVKAHMTDKATCIDHPCIVLLLDEANGCFGIGSGKGCVWVEYPTVGFNDLAMPTER